MGSKGAKWTALVLAQILAMATSTLAPCIREYDAVFGVPQFFYPFATGFDTEMFQNDDDGEQASLSTPVKIFGSNYSDIYVSINIFMCKSFVNKLMYNYGDVTIFFSIFNFVYPSP